MRIRSFAVLTCIVLLTITISQSLFSCNSGQTANSNNDSANVAVDTTIVDSTASEDTTTLKTIIHTFDMTVDGTAFYNKYLSTDLMLFTFQSTSSNAVIKCTTINGTVTMPLILATGPARNISGTTFRL